MNVFIISWESEQSGWIQIVHLIIITIGEHIVAYESLTGGDEDIGINEPAHLGIIVTAVEVIEVGFCRVVLFQIEREIKREVKFGKPFNKLYYQR